MQPGLSTNLLVFDLRQLLRAIHSYVLFLIKAKIYILFFYFCDFENPVLVLELCCKDGFPSGGGGERCFALR